MNQFLFHQKEQEKLYFSIIRGLLTTVISQSIACDINFLILESDVRISDALLFVFLVATLLICWENPKKKNRQPENLSEAG